MPIAPVFIAFTSRPIATVSTFAALLERPIAIADVNPLRGSVLLESVRLFTSYGNASY